MQILTSGVNFSLILSISSISSLISILNLSSGPTWNSNSGSSAQGSLDPGEIASYTATYTIGSIFTAANVGTGTGKARNRTTVAKIAGTTLTGSGAHLNSAGDFYLGNASANKYVFWDQSAGTMTLRGNLNAGDINAGTLTAVSVKGGSMPDANAAPTGTESGAFMDLGNGRVVFGNATKHIFLETIEMHTNKYFLKHKMYFHKSVSSKTHHGRKIIKKLFAFIKKNPKKFINMKNYKNISLERIICDYIAGMTDRYAINLYKKIK